MALSLAWEIGKCMYPLPHVPLLVYATLVHQFAAGLTVLQTPALPSLCRGVTNARTT